MNNNWIEIIVENPPYILEEISSFLFEMGCSGIEEGDKSFKIYFAENDWNDQLKERLIHLCVNKNIPELNISLNIIKTENWNENWKENFKVFHLGENIIIQPDWANYQSKKNEYVITIAPKMAFGTGHHETTQLILKRLEKEMKAGLSVLDAGTGSGILAIYCALLKASKIVAFDNDPVAIENATENLALNGVLDKINLLSANLYDIKEEQFDLIIANINKNILIEFSSHFANYANSGTKLILSGLLDTDKKEIIECYEKNKWIHKNCDQLNEWISLQFVYSAQL